MTKKVSFITLIRRIVLIGFIFGITWLGFWVLVVPFNKHEGLEFPIVDCNTNAEFVIAMYIWLIWASTIGIVFWMLIAKRTLGNTLETIALALAIALSLFGVYKYYSLLEYSDSIEKLCE